MVNQGEKNSHGHESSKADKLADRQSDATTDETVSDLQKTEEDSGSNPNPDPGPSPDGALDEMDETKDLGPM